MFPNISNDKTTNLKTMANTEYENQEWLYAWLRHRTKYNQEYLNNIDKYKTTVRNLNFSWQNLKGKFIIENFPQLQTLHVGNNELEDLVIKNCPQLKQIVTSHNQLTRLEIKDCNGVKELYTHNNKLTDLDISELKNLKVLSYSDNPLVDSKKDELKALGLSEKTINSGNPTRTLTNDYFIDNQEITEIDISNEAGWEGKLEVRNCPNLTSLVVDNCKLTALNIVGCPNLKTLSFRHNQVKKINLSGLPELENLYCSNNRSSKLKLDSNLKLKNLVCDNNPIEVLNVKHLQDLESLYCFRCGLDRLDCSGLENLKELYCAYSSTVGMEYLNIDGCDSLEILDCAENSLSELNVTDKPYLETISVKENCLEKVVIKNCPNLEQLDFSRQSHWKDCIIRATVSGANNLKKVFYDKKSEVPSWSTFPQIELVQIGEYREIEKNGNKTWVYTVNEETDFIALRNISKIEQILNSPNDYSLEDLLKLGRKELCGVPTELRDKLVKLAQQKSEEEFRERFVPYQSPPTTPPPLEKDNSPSETSKLRRNPPFYSSWRIACSKWKR